LTETKKNTTFTSFWSKENSNKKLEAALRTVGTYKDVSERALALASISLLPIGTFTHLGLAREVIVRENPGMKFQDIPDETLLGELSNYHLAKAEALLSSVNGK